MYLKRILNCIYPKNDPKLKPFHDDFSPVIMTYDNHLKFKDYEFNLYH